MSAMSQIGLLLLAVLTQAATGSVTGRLFSVAGVPQGGVRVALVAATSEHPEKDATMIRLTQSDASGTYRLDDVPAGNYFIAAGALDSPSYYPGSGSASAAKAITVVAGATTRVADFSLVRSGGMQSVRTTASAGKLTGYVYGVTNKPLPNVTISLSPIAVSDGPFLTSTNRDGFFEVSGIAAGEYTFTALSPLNSGYQSLGYEWVKQPVTLQENQGIDVGVKLRMVMPLSIQRGRPDLYAPAERLLAGGQASISANALTLESGEWLLDPRTVSNHTAEVDIEVVFSDSGRLLTARIVDPSVNPELARTAVERVRTWRLALNPVDGRGPISFRTVVAIYPALPSTR